MAASGPDQPTELESTCLLQMSYEFSNNRKFLWCAGYKATEIQADGGAELSVLIQAGRRSTTVPRASMFPYEALILFSKENIKPMKGGTR
jgi:hypothetical protein